MPIQQNPNKRRGEERSETLIIPHITREMLEVARAMAEKGASRAEIEAALAAMQPGKTIDQEKLKKGGYNVAIVFSSSKDGGNFNGAIGSTLYIDEVELIYKSNE